ncbi:MAG: hypothetical protein RL196_302 [Actinomycetota bacterium]|jgi:hypothetical protein
MKVLLARATEFETWIGRADSTKEVRQAVRSCRDKFILCSSQPKKEFKKLIATVENEGVQELLIGLIDSTSFLVTDNPSELEDSEFLNKEYDDFLDVISSSEFDEALSRHTRDLSVGEYRSDGFERVFGHVLESATSVEIIDPYLAAALDEGREVASWIMEKITRSTPLSVKLISKVPSSGGLSKVITTLNVIKNKLPKDVQITVEIFKSMPHDRYMKVGFKNGAIWVSLPKGIDTFMHEKFSELHVIKDLDKAASAQINTSVEWVPAHSSQLRELPGLAIRPADGIKIFFFPKR